MNPFARLFGSAAPRPAAQFTQHSQLHAPSSHGAIPATPGATRRELLRVVLRDTLSKNGIPSAWIGGDILSAMSKDKEPGLHLRLAIRHWDPRLLECAVAFQKEMLKRAEMFDPTVHQWLLGISWQFQLDTDEACPDLPDAVTWTAPLPGKVPAEDRRAALNKLLDVGDDGFDRPSFESTQPAFAPTEPARF